MGDHDAEKALGPSSPVAVNFCSSGLFFAISLAVIMGGAWLFWQFHPAATRMTAPLIVPFGTDEQVYRYLVAGEGVKAFTLRVEGDALILNIRCDGDRSTVHETVNVKVNRLEIWVDWKPEGEEKYILATLLSIVGLALYLGLAVLLREVPQKQN